MEKKCLSFVIPCYKSERTISCVIKEVSEVMKGNDTYDYEIIAVNDGSPDAVYNVLKELAKADSRITAIDLAKNLGQHAAMMAGCANSMGDIIIFMDDDGQCPVEQLFLLLKPIECGYDVAIAKYGLKEQSLFKNICSMVNEYVANCLLDKPKDIQMGNFMAIKKFVIDEMLKYENPYPYISGLFFRTTDKIANVPMKERKRMDGTTTYTIRKLFSLWINSFTAFSVKPLRIATVVGILISCLGFLYGIFVIASKIINPNVFAGWSSIMAILLFIGGMLMTMLGIIGEYVGRIYISINNSPQYVIREKIHYKYTNGD